MRRSFERSALALEMLRDGEMKAVLAATRKRLNSDAQAVGLRRDLDLAHPMPAARADVELRVLSPDEGSLLEVDKHGPESTEQLSRRRLLCSGLGTCFAAVAPDGDVRYVQWLIPSTENKHLARYFGGEFPELAEDEALLEAAYTFPRHRGLRIMPRAMAEIAERAGEVGARHVLTFCAAENMPSIKGCERAGFHRYLTRDERWRFWRLRCSFRPYVPEVVHERTGAEPVAGENGQGATEPASDRLGAS